MQKPSKSTKNPQTNALLEKNAYIAVVFTTLNNRIMEVYVYVDYREEKGGEIEFSTPEVYATLQEATVIKEVMEAFATA